MTRNRLKVIEESIHVGFCILFLLLGRTVGSLSQLDGNNATSYLFSVFAVDGE